MTSLSLNWQTQAGQVPPTGAAVYGPDGNYYIADYNKPKYYVWNGSSYTTVDMTQYFSDYTYGFRGIDYSSASGNNLVLIGHDGTIFTNSSGSNGTWSKANYLDTSVDSVAGYSNGYIISSYYGSVYSLTGTHITDLINYSCYRPFKSFVVDSGYGYVISGLSAEQSVVLINLSTGVCQKILSAAFINDISPNLVTATLTENLVSGISSVAGMAFLTAFSQIAIISGTTLALYDIGSSSPATSITLSFTPTNINVSNNNIVVWDSTNVSFYTYQTSWENSGNFTSTNISWVESNDSSAFILTSSSVIPLTFVSPSWEEQTALSLSPSGNIVIARSGDYAILPTTSNITSLIKTTSGWDINDTFSISGVTWMAKDDTNQTNLVYAYNSGTITAYNTNGSYTSLSEAYVYPSYVSYNVAARFYVYGGRIINAATEPNVGSVWCPFIYSLAGTNIASGLLTIANRNLFPEANLFTTNFQYPIVRSNPVNYKVNDQYMNSPSNKYTYEISQIGVPTGSCYVPYILSLKPNVSYTIGYYTDLSNASSGTLGSIISTVNFSTSVSAPQDLFQYSSNSFTSSAAGSSGFNSTTATIVPTTSWSASMTATSTPTPTTIIDSNGNFQVCVGSGTTGSTEPTWGTSLYSKTTDGGVTWQNVGIENTALPLYIELGNPSGITFSSSTSKIYWGRPLIQESSSPTSVIGYRIVGNNQVQLMLIPENFYSLSSTGATLMNAVNAPLLGYNSLVPYSSGDTAMFSALPINTLVPSDGSGTINLVGGAPPNYQTTQIAIGPSANNSGTEVVFNTIGGGIAQVK